MDGKSAVLLKRSEDIACRKIGDEALLVPIQRSPEQKFGVFTLNNTASCIWDHLDGSRSIEQLAQVLVQRFRVEIEQARVDVRALCDDLIAIGAISVVDGEQRCGT